MAIMSSYKLFKVQKIKLADDKENHLVCEYNIILHDNYVIDDDGYSCSGGYDEKNHLVG